MKYGKGKKIAYSIIIVALAVFLTVAVMLGLKNGYGSAKDINLGLDLAGVSALHTRFRKVTQAHRRLTIQYLSSKSELKVRVQSLRFMLQVITELQLRFLV